MQALILGRRRQGKSTLSIALGLAAAPTVVVFDPNNQYAKLPHAESIEELEWFLQQESGIVVYQPDPGSIDEEFAALIDELCGLPGQWRWKKYALVIDEISCLENSNWIHSDLERFIRQCPDDLSLIANTHRIADTNRLHREQATDLFFFSFELEADLRTIEEQYGPDVAAAVRGLARFECVHRWQHWGGADGLQVWKDSSQWNVMADMADIEEQPNGTPAPTPAPAPAPAPPPETQADPLAKELKLVRKQMKVLSKRMKGIQAGQAAPAAPAAANGAPPSPASDAPARTDDPAAAAIPRAGGRGLFDRLRPRG